MNVVPIDLQVHASESPPESASANGETSFREALDGELGSGAPDAEGENGADDATAAEGSASAEESAADAATLAAVAAELAAERGGAGVRGGTPAVASDASAAPDGEVEDASGLRARLAPIRGVPETALAQGEDGSADSRAGERQHDTADRARAERFERAVNATEAGSTDDRNTFTRAYDAADEGRDPLPPTPQGGAGRADNAPAEARLGTLAPAPASGVDTPIAPAAQTSGGAATEVAGAERVYAGSNATEVVRDRIEWLATRGGGRARLELYPPELGRVDLTVRVRGETVDVRIVAHEAPTAALLQGGRLQLGEALESHSLQMERFDVGGDASGSTSQHDRADRDRDDPGARDQGTVDGETHDDALAITSSRPVEPGRLHLRV